MSDEVKTGWVPPSFAKPVGRPKGVRNKSHVSDPRPIRHRYLLEKLADRKKLTKVERRQLEAFERLDAFDAKLREKSPEIAALIPVEKIPPPPVEVASVEVIPEEPKKKTPKGFAPTEEVKPRTFEEIMGDDQ